MSRSISGHDFDSVYARLAIELSNHGNEVNARGLATTELTNYQFEIRNPRARILTNAVRNMDMKYCIGELCFYLAGSYSLDYISHYSKFWLKLSDDNATVNSAYGYRLFTKRNVFDKTQFNNLIHTLFNDPSSRKAVLSIYAADDAHESKDNPCTMFLQFMIRENKLECYTFMRSNDIWLGTPYDVAFFTLVQEIVFVSLRNKYPTLELGSYFHHASSLHVYANHKDALYKCGALTERLKAAVALNDYQPTLFEGLSIEPPPLIDTDIDDWFAGLLMYEHIVRTTGDKAAACKLSSKHAQTPFQNWCKSFLE